MASPDPPSASPPPTVTTPPPSPPTLTSSEHHHDDEIVSQHQTPQGLQNTTIITTATGETEEEIESLNHQPPPPPSDTSNNNGGAIPSDILSASNNGNGHTDTVTQDNNGEPAAAGSARSTHIPPPAVLREEMVKEYGQSQTRLITLVGLFIALQVGLITAYLSSDDIRSCDINLVFLAFNFICSFSVLRLIFYYGQLFIQTGLRLERDAGGSRQKMINRYFGRRTFMLTVYALVWSLFALQATIIFITKCSNKKKAPAPN